MHDTIIDKIDDCLLIKQVEKICRSVEFKSKELLCRFLSYIVSEYLAGRGEKIKGYSIGVDVFNRGDDFDPDQDALVRIHAGRLRRMLDLYYLKEGKYDEIRIEIPKGAYTPIFISRSQSISSGKENAKEDEEVEKSFVPKVAIMPFRNMTGNPDKDYFAQGFSEELSVELTKYEDLVVFNSIQFSSDINNDFDIREEIRIKGVKFIIEGAVNKSEDKVKILVRLTDLSENKQVWAESYSRKFAATDLIEIQESIAKEISGILGSEYGIILQKLSLDSERIKPQQLDTYRAVLKYYYFLAHQNSESATQAFNALNSALQKEPESGIATALLATLHGNWYMLDAPSAKDSFKLMGELAERANKLDPSSLTVNVALAFKHFVYDERQPFFEVVEKCLAMNPANSLRLGSLAFHLSLFGDWERGYRMLHQLMQTNIGYPLYLHGSTCLYFYRKKEYDNALIEATKYKIPALFWGNLLRIAVLGQLNRKEEAETDISQLLQLKPDFKENARYLISRYVKEEELVEFVIEGLQKASMKV